MELPHKLHVLRHKSEYFGLRYNNKTLVFGFPHKAQVKKIHDHIKNIKAFPSMTVDKDKNIIIHKLPPRKKKNNLSLIDFVIVEEDTDMLIVDIGINGVETCIVKQIKDSDNFLIITDYLVANIDNPGRGLVLENLNNLYEKS